MKTEKEIREELVALEKRLKGLPYSDTSWSSLNARKWALKWVLEEEK